jgi:hypothetical protein
VESIFSKLNLEVHYHAIVKRKGAASAVVTAHAAANAAVNAIVVLIKIANVPLKDHSSMILELSNKPKERTKRKLLKTTGVLKKKPRKNKSLSQLHVEIKKHHVAQSIQMMLIKP